jgi:hypothetical protein
MGPMLIDFAIASHKITCEWDVLDLSSHWWVCLPLSTSREALCSLDSSTNIICAQYHPYKKISSSISHCRFGLHGIFKCTSSQMETKVVLCFTLLVPTSCITWVVIEDTSENTIVSYKQDYIWTRLQEAVTCIIS